MVWTGEITVKVAIDLYGGVDDLDGKAERFTSPFSLDAVHRLRRHCDAVLVGVGTVIRDDPSLTIRRVESTKQPLRVIIDPKCRAPPKARLFTDGFDTIHFANSQEPWTNLATALDTLQTKFSVNHLMVEGGPATVREFFVQKLVDRAIIIRAPLTFSQPVPSGIDSQVLREAGLSFHSARLWDTDTASCWMRAAEDHEDDFSYVNKNSPDDPLWNILEGASN